MARRLLWTTLAALVSLTLSGACSEKESPGYYRPPGSGGSAGESGAAGAAGQLPLPPRGPSVCPGQEPIDPSQLCGNEVIPVDLKRPNLYFLLDVSGSMEDRIGARLSKLQASKAAILRVAEVHGHRLNYGLATFPSSGDECAPGREIFRTREGDALKCGEFVKGSTYRRFARAVDDIRSAGGTPLTPTLEALKRKIRALPGPTSIVLLTDGAPNCNPDARCDASECSLSLARVQIGDIQCSDRTNCCDPRLTGDVVSDPGTFCLDSRASVELVEELREDGIVTYVIGVPGAEIARDLMNDLAEAGGAPRSGATKYFDVRDEKELDDALAEIGVEVAQSCSLELENPPTEAVQLNVYLDGVVLPSRSQNGWGYRNGKVTLLGESCARVHRGEVQEIRVVLGCDLVLY